MTTKDLKRTKNNPRTITDGQLERLDENYKEFGSLSGVIYNELLEQLVSGNQRITLANLKAESNIEIIERFKKPKIDGTTAFGYILIDGVREPYRAVSWNLEKHEKAVIIANLHAGEWNVESLNENWANVSDLWVNEVKFDMPNDIGVDEDESQSIDDIETSDEFSLKGGDKEPFQQMTFTFADEQATIVKNAIADIKETDEYKYCETMGNENSNGNALYLIIATWAEQRI